jgi:hypothetical protein
MTPERRTSSAVDVSAPRISRAAIAALAVFMLEGCASTGFDPAAKIAIVATNPVAGSRIEADTRLRIVAEYSLPKLESGRDQITIALKTSGAKAWEPAHFVLAKPNGRVTLEISGAEVLRGSALVHPLQMLLWLDRGDSPEHLHTLRASDVITFDSRRSPEEEQLLNAKMLPPQIGRGQLLTDVFHIDRYKPKLPPKLNVPGADYWGIYKVCVDTDGGVFKVDVLRRASPTLDPSWTALIRTWRHQPYSINGVPVPYCYPLRVEVRASP